MIINSKTLLSLHYFLTPQFQTFTKISHLLFFKIGRNYVSIIVNIITNKTVLQLGLSINILCAGDKSPVQRGFFTNSVGDLLPALGFLGGFYNFCNFVNVFSLM